MFRVVSESNLPLASRIFPLNSSVESAIIRTNAAFNRCVKVELVGMQLLMSATARER
jgi:hypothetical protein